MSLRMAGGVFLAVLWSGGVTGSLSVAADGTMVCSGSSVSEKKTCRNAASADHL